jgi:hypothetical protein
MLTPCVLTTLANSTPNDDDVEPDPGKTPLLFAAAVVGAAPSPVAKLSRFVVPNQLIPRSRPAFRSTSRMCTFSITCCEGETFIASITGASGERPFATSTARAAATESVASPLRTTSPLALVTLMSLPPVLAAILLCSELVSGATSRSMTETRCRCWSNTEMFVAPTFFPWT